MKLYYAIGGGLGHLTRASAFLRALGIENNSAILTSSVFAGDKRVVNEIKLIQVERNYENDIPALRKFLCDLFAESKFDTLYIDSFPLGIVGEFSDFEFPDNLEINYLARLLKWKNYSHFLKKKIPYFKRTFILEPLEGEHQKFIDRSSERQIEFELKYPKFVLNAGDEEIFQFILNEKSPFWLIVHAGNREETLELIDYASEMREIEKTDINLILISPQKFRFQYHNLFQFNLYPACILFERAQRIFTACGFNSIEQAKEFRNKHFFIPFERRFDDQFGRAKRFR